MQRVPFKSLLEKIIDNRGRTCPISNEGVPLIATNCVKSSTLYPVFEKIRYVSSEVYETWFRGHPKPGDMIFVTKGSPGEVCWTPEPVGFCIAQDMVALRADAAKVYPKYLFAALRSPSVKHDIDNMHVGSLIPHFKKGDFDKLFIPVPDRPTQIAIGDLHFALCEKIDLNRRMNETLEALARIIFQDWFVDFGPTRAKIEGRAAYLAPGLWKLFPDRLDDAGLPEGWKKRPLDEIAEFLNGLALQKFPASDKGNSLPVIKIAELRSGVSQRSNQASRDLPQQYVVKDGDFLFSWSGSLVAKFWTGGEGALNQHLFKVTSPNYSPWFFSQWIYHHLEEFKAIAASKATTMGHIQRGHLTAAMTNCPPESVLTQLGCTLAPLLDKIIGNDLEARNLAEMRDFLLPKLMSGETSFHDAEKIAGEAL